jgi:hypothetical protein
LSFVLDLSRGEEEHVIEELDEFPVTSPQDLMSLANLRAKRSVMGDHEPVVFEYQRLMQGALLPEKVQVRSHVGTRSKSLSVEPAKVGVVSLAQVFFELPGLLELSGKLWRVLRDGFGMIGPGKASVDEAGLLETHGVKLEDEVVTNGHVFCVVFGDERQGLVVYRGRAGRQKQRHQDDQQWPAAMRGYGE